MADRLLHVACIQMNSGTDIEQNLTLASDLIRQAAKAGAKLIITPENTCSIYANAASKKEVSVAEEDHPAPKLFSALAKELGITLIIGSITSITADDGRNVNRSFVFDENGKEIGRYDKIHLFDVTVSNKEKYTESTYYKPGNKTALIETLGTKIGLSICYDLRFPALYQQYAKAGAEILVVPAAFTVPTGQAHWHSLLMARAIETGSFVLAPAQWGTHDNTRQTYGHSLIIDPWGEILAERADGNGFIEAKLSLDRVPETRHAIPAIMTEAEYT